MAWVFRYLYPDEKFEKDCIGGNKNDAKVSQMMGMHRCFIGGIQVLGRRFSMPRQQGYNFYNTTATPQYHELNILSQPTSLYATHNATQVSESIYANKPLQYTMQN